MKKGLIGVVILAFVALVCGTAFAATFDSIDIEATLEWTIFDQDGLMPAASGDAPAVVVPDLTITAGPWEASTDGNYIKYTAEIGSISFKNSVGYGIYDLGADITEAQGVVLASLRWDAVYTTNSEYGVGAKYDVGAFSIGGKYNSTGSYGVELVIPIAPVTLTGQYVPETEAYLVKSEYALSAGKIIVQYKVASAPEISAELADFPVGVATLFGVTVASIEDSISITGKTETTLSEGITLKLDVASAEGALTYSGKLGVSF